MRKARQRWGGVLLLVRTGKVVPAREESRRRRDGVGSNDRRKGRRVPTKAAAAGCSSRVARPRRRPSWPPACSAQPGCIRGRVAAQGLQAMGFRVPPGCLGSEPSHARSGAALALGPQRWSCATCTGFGYEPERVKCGGGLRLESHGAAVPGRLETGEAARGGW